MRIRKRAVPLPLSLLSPVPFSDLHLHLVQLPHHHHADSQPSDHLPPPPSDNLRGVIPYDRDSAVVSQPLPQPQRSMEHKDFEDEKNKKQEEDINTYTSKQSISGAVADCAVVLPPPSTPSNRIEVVATDGRWCDGDKAIPLKKRKVSFEMNGVVVTREAKMKSKTNKKCPPHNTSEEEERDEDDDDDEKERRKRARDVDYTSALNVYEDKNVNKKMKMKSKKGNVATGGAKNSSKSKSKRGGSIMEGSRCSRVNGRGWRCLQPTLVGYSLCEHHLGKGRLRSISSVRVRASSSSSQKPSNTPSFSPSLPSDLSEEKTCSIALEEGESPGNAIQEDSSCGRDHTKPVSTGNKKRTKLGMVKARSLSSLLCQPDTAVLVQTGATPAIKQHEM